MIRLFYFVLAICSITVHTYPENTGIADGSGTNRLGIFYENFKLKLARQSLLIKRAEELCDKEDFDNALIFFNLAIGTRPNCESFRARGMCHQRMGRIDEAISDFQERGTPYRPSRVHRDREQMQLIWSQIVHENWSLVESELLLMIEKHSESVETFLIVASEFCNRKRYEDALRIYTALITQHHDDHSIYFARGECYLRLGDLFVVREQFQKAAELDSTVPEAEKDGYDQVLLSLALFNVEKFDDALRKIGTLNDSQLKILAGKLFDEWKFDEAILCYTEAIEKSPATAEYYHKRGKCLMKIKDFELAVSDFQVALNGDASGKECLIDLLEALLGVRNYVEAKKLLMSNNNLLDDSGLTHEQHVRLNIIRRTIHNATEVEAPPA